MFKNNLQKFFLFLQKIGSISSLLPYKLAATRRAVDDIKNQNSPEADDSRSSYVIHDDIKEVPYESPCRCVLHQCKGKLAILKKTHKLAFDKKIKQLVYNDKLLEFYQQV